MNTDKKSSTTKCQSDQNNLGITPDNIHQVIKSKLLIKQFYQVLSGIEKNCFDCTFVKVTFTVQAELQIRHNEKIILSTSEDKTYVTGQL